MQLKADIGLIGLAVMGQNLVLNFHDHGYTVAVYNRTTSKVDEFLSDAAKACDGIIGTYSLEEFISKLEKPRKIMLMVKAGEVVDSFIQQLIPLLDAGDIIIDGGNSHYADTTRRTAELREKGLLFVGVGVSGGEEGARKGPSLMPGGNPEAWPLVKNMFQDIAAKVGGGTPCCDWVGADGAGHFVKMVHNGIEYGDMQMICEAYDVLATGLGLSHDEMHTIFNEWNKTELESYLVEITRDIMLVKDSDGEPLVTKILDKAGQKGTGKWTGISSYEFSVPVTLISEAVYARFLSSMKASRIEAAAVYPGEGIPFDVDKTAVVEDLRQALLASKLISYAQGYMLMREAAEQYGWDLNYGGIALMWRGGCIIRSVFLERIKEAFDNDAEISNILLDPYFIKLMNSCRTAWRKTVSRGVLSGIPLPAMSSALAFFDGYRKARLPANLLQAQRDYFGAHTYERIDQPEGAFFHTNWTGTGGNISSSTYEA